MDFVNDQFYNDLYQESSSLVSSNNLILFVVCTKSLIYLHV